MCFYDYYAGQKKITLSLYTTQVVIILWKQPQLLRFLASFIWNIVNFSLGTRVFCIENFNFTCMLFSFTIATRFIRIFIGVWNLAFFPCRLLPSFTAFRILAITGITTLSYSLSQCLAASVFLIILSNIFCPPFCPSCPSWSWKSLPRFPICLHFLSLM